MNGPKPAAEELLHVRPFALPTDIVNGRLPEECEPQPPGR